MGWTGYISRAMAIKHVIDRQIFPESAPPPVKYWVEGPEWAMNGVERNDLAKYVEIEVYAVIEREDGSRHAQVSLIEPSRLYVVDSDLKATSNSADVWMVKTLDESVGPTAVPKKQVAKEMIELLGPENESLNGYAGRYRQRLHTKAAIC